uniref:TrmE-type G domain-containing protein n=1 Tax=Parascaris univalens TaxID=6257 RepID=A0A915BSA6_PARUN
MDEDDEVERQKRHSPPSFTHSMRSIRQCSWYWGNMSWLEAEKVLMDYALGTYLIRDSASDRYIFTISYRTANSVHHTRLPQHGGKFCLGGPNSLVRSESLMAFVETLQRCGERGVCLLMHEKGDRAATQTMALNKALHRHELLPPLKYLCRVVIRHAVSPSSLSKLPLPPKILRYVQDPRYLVPPC